MLGKDFGYGDILLTRNQLAKLIENLHGVLDAMDGDSAGDE